MMNISNKEYDRMTKKASPPSSKLRNCLCAFLFGGAICTFGELLFSWYMAFDMGEKNSRACASITLIAITAVLTALHLWEKFGKIAGAGALVPITGFANSVVSPAIEFKSEGMILGVGASMFKIAGPVIVYGVSASVIYGIIYWIITLF